MSHFSTKYSVWLHSSTWGRKHFLNLPNASCRDVSNVHILVVCPLHPPLSPSYADFLTLNSYFSHNCKKLHVKSFIWMDTAYKKQEKKVLWHITWKRSSALCTLSLIIMIFTIKYNVLQLYYDKRCSPESWSSLLMSPLAKTAENNKGAYPSKTTKNAWFERRGTRQMFSGVLSCNNTVTRK